MNLELVKKIVNEIIKDTNYLLYDVLEDKMDNETILQILIDKKPAINIDELAELNNLISEKLDQIDKDWPPYLLEVSSPGAEKELRNLAEIKEYVGSYVYLEEKENYFGYLEDVSDEQLVTKINLKGRIKKIKIDLNELKFIRLAVKI